MVVCVFRPSLYLYYNWQTFAVPTSSKFIYILHHTVSQLHLLDTVEEILCFFNFRFFEKDDHQLEVINNAGYNTWLKHYYYEIKS